MNVEELANSLITKKDLDAFGDKLVEKIIVKLNRRGNPLQEYISPKAFALKTGIPYSTVVHRCKSRKLKSRQDEPKSAWLIHSSELERYTNEANDNY